MKRILITGASGFVGGFLVEDALKRGYDVYAGIRQSSDLSYLQDSRIKFFKTDLSNKQGLIINIDNIGGFDYVIHNAGVTKTCKKEQFNFVNFQITKNLVEALIESKYLPIKYIQISSLAAYGPGDNKTFEPVKNSDKPNPVSLYGESKLKAERYLNSLSHFPYLIFRPTAVYGPREKDFYMMYQSINKGIETYIGKEKQHLSFVYVKDLAQVLLDSLESEIKQKSYFVSDLKNYTAQDFNIQIKKNLNKKTIKIVVPIFIVKIFASLSEFFSCFLKGKVSTLNKEKYKEISENNWLCNANELITDFNYKPQYPLEKGMQKTIEWYKEKGLL